MRKKNYLCRNFELEVIEFINFSALQSKSIVFHFLPQFQSLFF